MSRDKRRYKRLHLHGFVETSTTFEIGDTKMETVPLVSISAGGMFVAPSDAYSPGLQLGAALRDITINEPELKDMMLKGRVVHRMSLGQVSGCGIEFVGILEDQQGALDRFVHRKLVEFGLES